MIIDSPIISGSQNSSGPLTQIGDVYITGSLNVLGAINGSITGSITSASYATNAEFLDRLDSTSFVFTSSFNTFSGSAAGRITNLEAFSSSLDATFATDASVTASILVLSGSVQASQAALSSSYTITSGSYANASASLSIRVTNVEATASVNTQASASFAAYSASVSTRLTTDETNITTLTNASGSFAAQSASLSTRITQDETNFTNLSSSFATTSGSISSRVTIIEGQYATTGSNTFTGPQFINQASNAISFTSTASLYTPGGARISKDLFVSGTSYFNNVVVYGTSSIQYITSSQVNFGTNIITVNTDTPAVRFGGLAVFDSGSTQLTGSMLWDSERNHWIYSNPSGSAYNSAMLMNGPRNTGSLGSEQGTTACAMMIGQGGDHITSSMIYSYGNATCFYGQSFISASGDACFSGQVCAPSFIGGTISGTTGTFSGNVNVTVANTPEVLLTHSDTSKTFLMAVDGNNAFFRANSTNNILFQYAGGTNALNINGSTGAACFNNLITACSAFLQVPSTAAVVDILRLNNPAVTNSGTRLKFENGYGDLAAIRVTHMDNGSLADDGQIEFQTAQNTVLGTRMTILNTGIACFSSTVCAPIFLASGCVGIGVSTPVSSLHIIRALGSDVINIGESGTGTRFAIGQEAAYTGNYINSRNIDLKLQAYCAGGSGGNIHLQTGTDGTGCVTTKMFICSIGNVGIGTLSPDTLLTIDTQIPNFSTGTLARFYASKGTTEGAYLQINATRHSTQSVRRVELYAYEGASCNANLVLQPNGGRLGIGTYTPGQTLSVEGNSYFGCLANTLNFSQGGCDRFLEVGSGNGGDALYIAHSSGYGVGYFGYEASNDRLVIATDCGGGANKIDFILNAGTATGGTADNLNVCPVMRITSGNLILACGRTSSIMASSGNIQEWVGLTGVIPNNTGWSLFSIANQYDNLSMDMYVFTDVGSFQTSKHEAVFGYTSNTFIGIGFSSAFCVFKTGTTFNETMTICNLSGSQINSQRIAIRVWGYGVGQNGTGGTNLLTTSCLTRIK